MVAQSSFNVAHVVFTAGGDERLALSAPASLAGTLSGFGAGDTIGLGSQAATGLSFAGGVLTVLNGTTALDTLHFVGSYTTADFSLEGIGTNDVSIAYAGAASLADIAPHGFSDSTGQDAHMAGSADPASFAHFASVDGGMAGMDWAAAHFIAG